MEDTSNLNPCSLGTKDYWETAYDREIKNYEDHGDVGEIWFDENSQLRIIKWLNKHNISKDTPILDLGTGNGMMLQELSSDEFSNLTGVDYSEKSIEFAKKIANDQGHSHIKFKVADILSDSNELGTFKIVHDKGTFDAIALMENATHHKRTYVENVSKLTEELFIITSCNFTEEELLTSFSDSFIKFETIPTPTIQFGGKQGNKTVSLCFKKK